MPQLPWSAHTEQCVCGKRLTGRQERHCSASCRAASSRIDAWDKQRRTLGLPDRKPCRFCGELFITTALSSDACSLIMTEDADGDESSEASDHCRWLQNDEKATAADARLELFEARMMAVCTGPDCDSPCNWASKGRPRKFCSNRCKTRAQRAKAGAR